MSTTLETCRILYNRLLAWRKDAYEQAGKSPSRYEQQAVLPQWKRENEFMQRVHSQVLQEVNYRVHRSFESFFRRCKSGDSPGYPRFKGPGQYDSFTYTQTGFRLGDNSVRLSKIGEVKAVVHRKIDGVVKSCTVHRSEGKWFACLSIETEPCRLEPTNSAVGVDVGLSAFAVLSNGDRIENPRFYRRDESDLRRASRKLSRSSKGTAQHARARKVVNKIHTRIANRRHDFIHQQTRRIVNSYGIICVEKLNVSAMTRNHSLAKSIGDAAWYQFRRTLRNKAESAGRKYAEVNPAFTSQICSSCGHIAKKSLSERWHNCDNCSASLDRDHNAALNILALGLQSLGIESVEAP